MLTQAGTHARLLAPGAGLGVLLLLYALLADGRGLGLSLWLGGGTYIAFLAAYHPRIDGAAPLVATLLLLSGELAAWSLDERWQMKTDPRVVWRRAGAVGLLALGGLAFAALALILSAAPTAHGLAWTVLGALAAVAAAGTGILLARR